MPPLLPSMLASAYCADPERLLGPLCGSKAMTTGDLLLRVEAAFPTFHTPCWAATQDLWTGCPEQPINNLRKVERALPEVVTHHNHTSLQPNGCVCNSAVCRPPVVAKASAWTVVWATNSKLISMPTSRPHTFAARPGFLHTIWGVHQAWVTSNNTVMPPPPVAGKGHGHKSTLWPLLCMA